MVLQFRKEPIFPDLRIWMHTYGTVAHLLNTWGDQDTLLGQYGHISHLSKDYIQF